METERVRFRARRVASTGSDGLAQVGKLELGDAIALGANLCEVVTSWADACDGTILRGLRPETIFVAASGSRRFVGAIPRPYYLLGNQSDFHAYPSVSFDPPGQGHHELDVVDAVFTVALLVWWAAVGEQPYVVAGMDYDRNQLDDRRIPFAGPAKLGHVLERALVAGRDARISIVELRSELFGVLQAGAR